MSNLLTIKNGNLPFIGFGTFRLPVTTQDDSWNAYESTIYALKVGYRHIDTAPLYRNEADVGRAIRDFLDTNSDVQRSDIFVTSKVSRLELEKSEIYESIDHTLKVMELDYIDMIILHQPCTKDINLKNWELLMNYQREYPEKVKHIGVSNFDEVDIQEIEDAGMVLPEFNQIEVNPFYPQIDLIKFCQEKGIYIVAHTSMAKGEMFLDTFESNMTRRIRANKLLVDSYREKTTILDECAKRNSVSPAQLMLRWGIQKGFTVLPRSNCAKFIEENILLDFEISDDDMKILDGLDCDKCTHPQFHKDRRLKNR
jgi:diketogulonate reductase-like aldo/keto reductase